MTLYINNTKYIFLNWAEGFFNWTDFSIEEKDFSIEGKDFSIDPTGFLERTLTCLTGEALTSLPPNFVAGFLEFPDSLISQQQPTPRAGSSLRFTATSARNLHPTLLTPVLPNGFHFSSSRPIFICKSDAVKIWTFKNNYCQSVVEHALIQIPNPEVPWLIWFRSYPWMWNQI